MCCIEARRRRFEEALLFFMDTQQVKHALQRLRLPGTCQFQIAGSSLCVGDFPGCVKYSFFVDAISVHVCFPASRIGQSQISAEFVRKSGIRIHWQKVASHTGNRWNERADELAKSNLISLSPEANNLEDDARGFVKFLEDHGYEAELKDIYNSDCAKIAISESDTDMGYVNIYITKKIPLLPRYHELKDQSHKDRLETLWREYHYGERQLSLGF